jgi:hypothetical protein
VRTRYNGIESGGGSVTAEDIEDALTAPGADTNTVRDALGAVPDARTVAGLSLASDRTAVEVATAVDRRFVDPLAGAGSGWTTGTPAGGASATWSAGKLTLAVPVSTAGAVGVYRASGAIPDDSPEWDILIRLDVIGGDGSSSTRIGIHAGKSSTDHVSLSMWTSGTIELGRTVGGSYGGASYGGASGLDSTARTGGQLWLMLSHRLGRVTAAWAVGTGGNVPTGWRVEQTLTNNAALEVAGGTYVEVWAATTDTSVSSGLTVEVLAIRARGAAPL